MTDLKYLDRVDAESLTTRQRRVFKALQKGKSPQQIATQMQISPAGVYGHIRSLKDKARPNGNGKRTSAKPTASAPTPVAQRANGNSRGDGAEQTAATGETQFLHNGYEAAVQSVIRSLEEERSLVVGLEEDIASHTEQIDKHRSAIEEAARQRKEREAHVQALDAARETLVGATR